MALFHKLLRRLCSPMTNDDVPQQTGAPDSQNKTGEEGDAQPKEVRDTTHYPPVQATEAPEGQGMLGMGNIKVPVGDTMPVIPRPRIS
ncbi:hypothetical protein DACRYDRAFT_20852 [Dacryopinax primogenitus]|uniref:Uncharacterized protein n=1 Tax=Dacryopinax primogenitus (strain DJM 731) TaxID=1858805 RepID=M5G251_DACPD|nr:uncharacterized protein DACRYDRAFT_20852 [Dacryopinax primogenitus]EJU04271.1 hypothetical protein DACRYDRAFT_20852 [Dacryopinax primogenitus]